MRNLRISMSERMTAEVPRWAIAPCNRTQYLAEHLYFVTLYASKVCQILEYAPTVRLIVLEMAMRHDVPETRTSDIPGPVKRQMVDREKEKEVIDEVCKYLGHDHEVFAGAGTSQLPIDAVNKARRIIKFADRLDEAMYLTTEINRGNQAIRHVLGQVVESAEKAADELTDSEIERQRLVGLLHDGLSDVNRGVVLPEGAIHEC